TENVAEFARGTFSGPTALAFDSRGRLFVSTLSGKILILLDNNEDGRADEVKTFATGLEQSLGLTFHSNGDLYVTSNIFHNRGRILRVRDLDGDDVADETTVIVDNLPSAGDHQTNRPRFGPDGLLYFGQGSATDNGTPVSPGAPSEGPLNAAILRVDVNDPVVEVFATGLRNPFGITFHPENGALFSTDGGSGEICQLGDCSGPDLSPPEEINWVVRGGNYGFPACEGTPDDERPGCAGVRAPIHQFSPHTTPTSVNFYTGPQAGNFKNQLLVTLFKEFNGNGGDLRRVTVEGDPVNGFQTAGTPADFILRINPIDPGDGPVDAAIDPITGDIYVARFDPLPHRDPNEHHNFIYRMRRKGSDALTFIGPPLPSAVKAGTGPVTISINGRRLKPGAVIFFDDTAVTTRPGANQFELLADLPANLVATERVFTVEVRNADGTRSNQQQFAVTKSGIPDPQPKTPQLSSMFVYKKKRTQVITPVTAVNKAKKFRLVVNGADFDEGAQLVVGGVSLEIESRSATEIVGRFPNKMLVSPASFSVQVRNENGRVSNTLTLTVL
ncbi:MAG TPA: PQQ-dependent sugar dehydrogenase, partial [Blastocatellia bacterium]|nr:PQQ-dependent sugar dehydrogenase [Blastocatellia bacterium]